MLLNTFVRNKYKNRIVFIPRHCQYSCSPLIRSMARAFGSSRFGVGNGSILLDSIHCTGTESDVSQCSHQEWGGHDCSHTEDAGVSCSTIGKTIDCT